MFSTEEKQVEKKSSGNFFRGGANDCTYVNGILKEHAPEEAWKDYAEFTFTLREDPKVEYKWRLKNLQNYADALESGVDHTGKTLDDVKKKIYSDMIQQQVAHINDLRRAVLNTAELDPISGTWKEMVNAVVDELYQAGAVDVRLILTYIYNKNKAQYYLDVPRFARSKGCSFIENASVAEEDSRVLRRNKEDEYIVKKRPNLDTIKPEVAKTTAPLYEDDPVTEDAPF